MRVEPLSRWMRFCCVGGGVFVVDFALIWLFKHFLPALAAVSLAYLLAVALHYLLNKLWVFAARQPVTGSELGRYAITVLACWASTVALVWTALHTVTSSVFVAKALAIAPVTLLGFVLMRQFVFRAAASVAGSDPGTN